MGKHLHAAFTLLEMAIIVAVIGILTTIAVPYYFRAREQSHRTACMRNMQKIQQAKELYSFSPNSKAAATSEDIRPYLQSLPKCPSGGEYEGWDIGTLIYCTTHDWRSDSSYAGFVP